MKSFGPYLNFNLNLKALAIAFFVLLLISSFSSSAFATAGINRNINFQGKVVNKTTGTNVADGNYNFTFKLWDAASSGTTLWTETRTGGNQVTVTDGIFRVALGSVTSFSSAGVDFNSDSLYLEVAFNGETMGSRIQFAAVPYALNAEKVSGLTVTNNGGNTLNIAASKTFRVDNTLTFTGTDSTSFVLPSTGGNLVTEAFTQTLTNKTIGSTGLIFSGATTDLTTVSNENLVLSPNGTGKVGIFNTNPLTELDVTGSASLSGTLTIGNGGVIRPQWGSLQFAYKSAPNTWTTGLTLDTVGNLGVGTTAPASRLDVGANGASNETLTVRSQGTAGIEILGDTDNDGGEVGTAYLMLSQDGTTNQAMFGISQSNGVDAKGNTYTNALANGTLFGAYGNAVLQFGTASILRAAFRLDGSYGLGTNDPKSQFHVTRPLSWGALGTALAVFDQVENQDLIAASKSGTRKFVVDQNGNVALAGSIASSSNYITAPNFSVDTSGNITTSGTTVTASSLATFNTAAALAFSGDITISGNDITNTTLNLGNGAAATIGTVSDDNLTITPNGTGNTILTGDFDTQVLIGASGATTEFPLLVRSGIGNNAALAVDNLNNGDLITASASGTTRFTVSTGGNVTAGTYNGNTITTGTGTLTIAASKILTISNTLTFAGTDGSTLNIGTGGTLGTNAYTSTAYAPIASPTFTGTVTIPTPFTLGATSVTSTGTQLNYLSAATGTTGTTSTNLVFSTSPVLVTPTLGAATATSLALGTNPAAAGTLRLPNDTYITARNQANGADINLIKIDSSNLVAFGVNLAAHTLGGAVTGNSQSITGLSSLSVNGGGSPDITSGTNANLTIGANGSGNFILSSDFDSGTTIGTAIAGEFPLLVRSGIGNNAALAVDQLNANSNLIVASAAGTLKFSVDANGNLGLAGSTVSSSNYITTTNFIVTTAGITSAADLTLGLNDSSATLSTQDTDENLTIDPNGTGTIFFHGATYGITSTGVLTVASCSGCGGGGGGTNYWNEISGNGVTTGGVIRPFNLTADLLLGGTATSSAKFSVLNILTGNPSASVSAQNVAGQAVFIDSTGFIQSTRNNTLTLGGDKTGDIAIKPRNGSGILTLAGTTVGNLFQSGTGFQVTGSGQFLGAADDESAPSYAFASDATKGMYDRLANQIGFAVQGAEIGYFDVNGFHTSGVFAADLTLGVSDTSATITTNDTNEDLAIDPNGSGTITLTSPTQVWSGTTTLTATSLDTITSSVALSFNPNTGTTYAFATSATTMNLFLNPTTLNIGTSGSLVSLGNPTSIASVSGVLSLGNTNSIIRPGGGSLSLGYKSGASTWGTSIVLQGATGMVGLGTTNPMSELQVTRPLSMGTSGTSLVVFDQIENQDIFAASKSGTRKFVVDQNGNIALAGSIALSTNYITAPNFSVDTSGNITTSGTSISATALATFTSSTALNLNPNTGTALTLGTTATTLTLFNANATAINIGPAAGTVTFNGGLTIASGKTFTFNTDAFTDLTGAGLAVTSNALVVSLTTSGTTGSTSSNSGLEVSTSGLTLLKGCNDNQILAYTDAGGWACAADATGGGGSSIFNLNSNGSITALNNTADFLIGGNSTASAKFVFGGLNAGTPTATFSGDLIINNKPATSVADMQKWTKITGAAGTIGDNSTTAIASVSAAAVWNGSLYIGTNKSNAAEIYRYEATGSAKWNKISQTISGTIASAGTANIDMISSMVVYNGYLYAGTTEANGAEVYRYDGGTTWTKVSGAAGTIAATTLVDGVPSMAVYGGKLYAGSREGLRAELYRYNGGTSWTAINTTVGTFVTTNTVGVDAITSMAVVNNQLILGTLKTAAPTADADVLRWKGTVGANSFVALNNAGTSGSYLIDNSAQTGYVEVSSMTNWVGKLVVTLRRGAGQADVLVYNGAVGTADVDNWTRLNSAAGTITTTAIDSVPTATVYNGRLYVGTGKTNSAEIYRYDGGTSWTRVSQNTVGQLAAGGTGSVDSISALIPYNHNSLFAGTQEGTTAEGYNYVVSIEESYALRFHAGTSQGGGESNNQQNLASIFFVASLSANVNNKQANTGSFVFTHGITTNMGSYDVAEDYPTRDDTLEAGDVVSIDENEKGFVRKSQENDFTAIGIYSEDPALRLSQDAEQINGGRSIPIALAGRVPVKVIGEVKPGDYLVPSSEPGIARRATKGSLVIGQAMEGHEGDGVGKVLAYVKSSSYNGSIAQTFANIDVNSDTFGSDVLDQLRANGTGVGNSEVVTDRLIAGLEIVTPKLTADEIHVKKLKADQIEGLEFLTDRIDSLNSKVATISSQKTPKSASEILAEKINERMESASASATPPQNGLTMASLHVEGLTTLEDSLRVKNNGLFEGILTVLDTITTNNFIVNGVSNFFGDTLFKGNVAFEGTATFAKDTGGTALIHKGSNKVEVVFDKEFEDSPIVNANISFDEEKDSEGKVKPTADLEDNYFGEGYSYIVVNKSKKGFVIVLNKKAKDDINFTWTALKVKDAKSFQSRNIEGGDR